MKSLSRKISKSLHILATNLFNPSQLFLDIAYPVYEWFHTSHEQYQWLESEPRFCIVKHYIGPRLVTVDIVEHDENGDYYGKGEFSSERFRLIGRFYADMLCPLYKASFSRNFEDVDKLFQKYNIS